MKKIILCILICTILLCGCTGEQQQNIEQNITENVEDNKIVEKTMITPADDFGNINYGYTGTILGLSPETLYKGAGYIQTGEINDNENEFYGDSEFDFRSVKKGIEMANDIGFRGILDLPLKTLFKIMGK